LAVAQSHGMEPDAGGKFGVSRTEKGKADLPSRLRKKTRRPRGRVGRRKKEEGWQKDAIAKKERHISSNKRVVRQREMCNPKEKKKPLIASF